MSRAMWLPLDVALPNAAAADDATPDLFVAAAADENAAYWGDWILQDAQF